MDRRMRLLLTEMVGTAVLVLGGCGTAVIAGDHVGTLGIAFAFGLSLLIMAYTIGGITGCHINPAVTLGLVLTGRTNKEDLPWYWIGQVVGGLLGALILFIIASGKSGFSAKASGFASKRVRQALTGRLQPRRGGGLRDRADGAAGARRGGDLPARLPARLRWPGRGHHPDRHSPDQHSGQQHLGESGAFHRRGGLPARLGLAQLWAFIVFPLIGGVLGAGIARPVADEKTTLDADAPEGAAGPA